MYALANAVASRANCLSLHDLTCNMQGHDARWYTGDAHCLRLKVELRSWISNREMRNIQSSENRDTVKLFFGLSQFSSLSQITSQVPKKTDLQINFLYCFHNYNYSTMEGPRLYSYVAIYIALMLNIEYYMQCGVSSTNISSSFDISFLIPKSENHAWSHHK